MRLNRLESVCHLTPRIAGAAGALAVLSSAGLASASSGIDSPDNGVEQAGRGSAWVARADDPLAAYYNPAGLVWQSSGVHAGLHLMFKSTCFTRLEPDGKNGKPVSPAPSISVKPGDPGGPPTELCAKGSAFPNPQIAAAVRVGKKVAIGLAVLGPHAVGNVQWPESVPYTNPFDGSKIMQPAAQRYMLISADSLQINPTISVAYSPTPDVALGIGFIWGVTKVEFVNFAESLSPAPPAGQQPTDDFYNHSDVKATLKATDAFVPGIVIGGLWRATPQVDLGGWFKWQDSIRASTTVHLESLYWKASGVKNDAPCAGQTDTKCNITDKADAGTIRFAIPMEAKLGVRYHHPRVGGKRPRWVGPTGATRSMRDPMSQDLFDVEFDATWAHNSAVQNLELQFQKGIVVRGTPGTIPVNGNIPHPWRDVAGFHLGGEFVAIQNLLAVRAGGFFETKGQDDAYLGLDFDLAQKTGLSGGATVRVGPVDISAAYQHTFYGTLDNHGKGQIHGLTGDATAPNYRTIQVINGGRLTHGLDEVALGGTVHF